jgi:hypothetical protein
MAHSVAKRTTAPLPSGDISVWDVLTRELGKTIGPRPENSVTPEEYAERAGITRSRAHQILRDKANCKEPALEAVRFRDRDRLCVCYIPVKK